MVDSFKCFRYVDINGPCVQAFVHISRDGVRKVGKGDFRADLRSEAKLLRCQYLVRIEVLVDLRVN